MQLLRIVLLLVIFSFPAKAEDLKDYAHNVCNTFIESRESFQAPATYECKVRRFKDSSEMKLKCFDFQSEDGQKSRTFASYYSGGSCSSSSVGEVNRDSSILKPLYAKNASVDGYGFGSSDQALTYDGRLFFTDGNDLRGLSGDEQIILCSLRYKYSGWSIAKETTSPICNKFQNNEFTSISNDIDPNEAPSFPEGRALSEFEADIDFDGIFQMNGA